MKCNNGTYNNERTKDVRGSELNCEEDRRKCNGSLEALT